MSEKIGKVALDTRFYTDRDRYSDGDETENLLLDIVSRYQEKEFPGIILQKASWPVTYHLSPMRESLLDWIPFKAGERILELGSGCGAVTGAFLRRGLHVTAVDHGLAP